MIAVKTESFILNGCNRSVTLARQPKFIASVAIGGRTLVYGDSADFTIGVRMIILNDNVSIAHGDVLVVDYIY